MWSVSQILSNFRVSDKNEVLLRCIVASRFGDAGIGGCHYKARVKGKSLIPNNEFEKKVMQIHAL
jgi:hypothetical protein